MSTIIHQIIKQAYKTFSKSDHYSSNYRKLNVMLNELRAKDIALEQALKTFLPQRKVLHGMAKITSYDSLQTPSDCARTSLMQPARRDRSEPIKCLLTGQHVVKDIDSTQTLQHDKNNYHTIEAVSGPIAFIDILAPPYDANKDRDCHYYIPTKNIPSSKQAAEQTAGIENDDKIYYLQRIPPPSSFYCDSVEYQGPPIAVEDLGIGD